MKKKLERISHRRRDFRNRRTIIRLLRFMTSKADQFGQLTPC